MNTRGLFAGTILLASFFYLIGCDENEPSGVGLIHVPRSQFDFVGVVGLSTLEVYDANYDEMVYSEPVGLGVGANWINSVDEEIYVINSISNSLQIIDANIIDGEPELLHTIDLGLQQNNNPYYGAFGKDNLYITNLMQNSFSVLNLNTLEIETTIQTGQAPGGIFCDGNYVYVINSGYDFSAGLNGHNPGSIYKYSIYYEERTDTLNGDFLDSLKLGINPQFIEYCQYDRTLHITCTGDYGENTGEIWILDTDLNHLNTITVDAYPRRILFTDPDFYIACGGWRSAGDANGLIITYNYEAPDLVRYINTDMGAMSCAGSRYYDGTFVACFDDMTLCVVKEDTVRLRVSLDDPPVAIHKLSF